MENQNQNLNPSIQTNPVSEIQKPASTGSNKLFFGIIFIFAAMIIGGFLIYKNYFVQTNQVAKTNQASTNTVASSEKEEIKTVADSLFKSKAELDIALVEIDNMSTNTIDSELAKNDSDASGFSE